MPNPLASIAGFGVTFGTMFRRVVTAEYPEEPHQVAPRFHGRHQLNRHPDGLEKCIGCELCAWACPADAIYVEGADNTEDERYSPGERYGRVYQINYLRCILCGLCIEACPTRALTMTNEYDLADYTRESLIYEKQDLLAPMLPGMEQPPHPMRLGDTERDYYAPPAAEPASEPAAEPAAGASGSTDHIRGSAAGASGSADHIRGSAAGASRGADDISGSAAGPAAGASTGGDA